MNLPALYISHGAPPLLDDELWMSQLATWAKELPKPKGIVIVSAHWESAPITISATAAKTPLIYDFGGFSPKFYNMTYGTPDATWLGDLVAKLMPDNEPLRRHETRGLDHGAWVPLKVMYPDADIPVIQLSMPTHDPEKLLELGARLYPLREQGVLVIGSGFMTHGLPFIRDWRVEADAPMWSAEFDAWAKEALARGDIETLVRYRETAPGMPYAHPTVEHFTPLFITLGASTNPEQIAQTKIDGYFMGLAKRSIQVA
ncbi:MAG: dioxygenase [Microbacteriaceae bacterium]|nr:dioxygenase [Microbacteriaceae bacterium]